MAARAALCALALTASVLADVNPESLAKAGKLQAMSRGGLAFISDGDFESLVRAANRDYHTFVLFNARGEQYQCALCGPFEDEVAILAASYWRQKKADKDGKVPDIFFVVADFSANRNVFGQYNLQSVPALVYFAPTAGVAHVKNKFPANAQYASELDAENAALFVREKTDFKIDVYRSPWGALLVLASLVASVGGVLYLLRSRIPALLAWLQGATFIWLLAGVGVYYIAVSGFLYDIIRGVPSVGYDPKTRRLIIFTNQSGTQYGLEGAVIGVLNVSAAAAVVLLARVFPKLRDSGQRSLFAAVAALVFAFMFHQIIYWYRYKNPWYNPLRVSTSGL